MKRKYYMRGLGIGVLVTAVIFAIASPKQKVSMTDEEVIARAQQLGYTKETQNITAEDIDKIKEQATGTPQATDTVEEENNKEASESTGTPGPTMSPVPTPDAPEPPDEPDKKVTPTPKPAAAQTPTPKPQPTATPTPKPTVTPEPTNIPTTAPVITQSAVLGKIKVERGMTATKVADLLVEIGAVNDARAFIKYLRDNNLTDFINIGTFTIPRGASYEEIARILTK